MTITDPTPNAQIYYTTDGSPPSPTNGTLYTGPINVERTRPRFVPRRFATATSRRRPSPRRICSSTTSCGKTTRRRSTEDFPPLWGSTTPDYGMDPDVIGNFNAAGNPTGRRSVRRHLRGDDQERSAGDSHAVARDGHRRHVRPERHLHQLDAQRRCLGAGHVGRVDLIRTAARASRSMPASKFMAGRFVARSEPQAFAPPGVQGNLRRQHEARLSAGSATMRPRRSTRSCCEWTRTTAMPGTRPARKRSTPATNGAGARRRSWGSRPRTVHACTCTSTVSTGAFTTRSSGRTPRLPPATTAARRRSGTRSTRAKCSTARMTAWNTLVSLSQAVASASTEAARTAAYMRVLGLNPDGTDNPSFETYLDAVNYVDYLLVNFYGGNNDWPQRNWFAARRKVPDSQGFVFHMWDFGMDAGSAVGRQHEPAGRNRWCRGAVRQLEKQPGISRPVRRPRASSVVQQRSADIGRVDRPLPGNRWGTAAGDRGRVGPLGRHAPQHAAIPRRSGRTRSTMSSTSSTAATTSFCSSSARPVSIRTSSRRRSISMAGRCRAVSI